MIGYLWNIDKEGVIPFWHLDCSYIQKDIDICLRAQFVGIWKINVVIRLFSNECGIRTNEVQRLQCYFIQIIVMCIRIFHLITE